MTEQVHLSEEVNAVARMRDNIVGPGSQLRLAREAMGLSIADVANQLHLTSPVIAALENDDYQAMPRLVFVRGYLRAYARLVKCNPDEVIMIFNQLGLNEDDLPESVQWLKGEKVQTSTQPKNHLKIGGALMVLVMAGLVGVWMHSQHQPMVTATNSTALPNNAVASNTTTTINTPDAAANDATSLPIATPTNNTAAATALPTNPSQLASANTNITPALTNNAATPSPVAVNGSNDSANTANANNPDDSANANSDAKSNADSVAKSKDAVSKKTQHKAHKTSTTNREHAKAKAKPWVDPTLRAQAETDPLQQNSNTQQG